MPPPSGDYELLVQSAPNEDELVEKAEQQTHSLPALTSPACLFLLCCSVVCMVIATLNLNAWQFRDFHNAYASIRAPRVRGNVYLGLSNVRLGRVLCRKRPFTYPTAYAVISGRDVRARTKVHAHFDETQFSFGGQRSAHVTFYIPDFVLENCTMIFRSVLPAQAVSHSSGSALRQGFFDSTTTLSAARGTTLDVYLLSAPDTLARRSLVAQLPLDGLGADGRLVTPPFWCPGQTHVSLQIECLGDCHIDFGLQGMTTATSLYALANKTGFVIEQHEHVSCIPPGA